MAQNCKTCGNSFEFDDQELKLFEKFKIPPSELCFRCHEMQLLNFRNERTLYQRMCDFSGDTIVSIYHPDQPYKVYQRKHWYGDKWNPLEYGRDFDFSRPFFEQFKELQLEVPRMALLTANCENSEYCNMAFCNKNCYLVFGGDYNEDTQYGTLCMRNVDCFDIDYSDDNEVSYFLNDSDKCFGCQYAFDSKNCGDSYFISDCVGCNDCILCTNLVKKQFCIENKQLTKEEYEARKKELMNGSYKQMQENFKKLMELRKTRTVKYYSGYNTQNCTGDYNRNSKNCINCFECDDCEDFRNVVFGCGGKDVFNSGYIGHGSELCYGCIAAPGAKFSLCSYLVVDSSDVEYSDSIFNSANIFGCVGLNHQKNCIFNKQYSVEEFISLREKIVEHMKETGEWGKILPKDLCCFAYNEGTSYKYFPLKKEEALKLGFKWRDEDSKDYQKASMQLPDNIADVNESIVDEVLACDDCGKNYKINASEFNFYNRFKIPVPRQCSECRHDLRLNLRSKPKLFKGKCANCSASFETTYLPDHTEKVLCEKCFLSEVF